MLVRNDVLDYEKLVSKVEIRIEGFQILWESQMRNPHK